MFLRICDSNHCYLSLETVINALITIVFVIFTLKSMGTTPTERWTRAGELLMEGEEEEEEEEETSAAMVVAAASSAKGHFENNDGNCEDAGDDLFWGIPDWWQMYVWGDPEEHAMRPVRSTRPSHLSRAKRDEPDTDIAVLSAFTFESRPASPRPLQQYLLLQETDIRGRSAAAAAAAKQEQDEEKHDLQRRGRQRKSSASRRSSRLLPPPAKRQRKPEVAYYFSTTNGSMVQHQLTSSNSEMDASYDQNFAPLPAEASPLESTAISNMHDHRLMSSNSEISSSCDQNHALLSAAAGPPESTVISNMHKHRLMSSNSEIGGSYDLNHALLSATSGAPEFTIINSVYKHRLMTSISDNDNPSGQNHAPLPAAAGPPVRTITSSMHIEDRFMISNSDIDSSCYDQNHALFSAAGGPPVSTVNSSMHKHRLMSSDSENDSSYDQNHAPIPEAVGLSQSNNHHRHRGRRSLSPAGHSPRAATIVCATFATTKITEKGSRKSYKPPPGILRSPAHPLRSMATTRSAPSSVLGSAAAVARKGRCCIMKPKPAIPRRNLPSTAALQPPLSPQPESTIPNIIVSPIPPSSLDAQRGVQMERRKPHGCCNGASENEMSLNQRASHPYLKARSSLLRKVSPSHRSPATPDLEPTRSAPRNSPARSKKPSPARSAPPYPPAAPQIPPQGSHSNNPSSGQGSANPPRDDKTDLPRRDPEREVGPGESNFVGHIASLISDQHSTFMQDHDSFQRRSGSIPAGEGNLSSQPGPSNTFAWPPPSGTGTHLPGVAAAHLQPSSSDAQGEVPGRGMQHVTAHEAASSSSIPHNHYQVLPGAVGIGIVEGVVRGTESNRNPQGLHLRAKQAALNVFVQESDCTCGCAPIASDAVDHANGSFGGAGGNAKEMQHRQRHLAAGRARSPRSPPPENNFAPPHHTATAAAQELAVAAAPSSAHDRSSNNAASKKVPECPWTAAAAAGGGNSSRSKEQYQGGVNGRAPSQILPSSSTFPQDPGPGCINQPGIPSRQHVQKLRDSTCSNFHFQSPEGEKPEWGMAPSAELEQSLRRKLTKEKIQLRKQKELEEMMSRKPSYYHISGPLPVGDGLPRLAITKSGQIEGGIQDLFVKNAWKVVPPFFEECQAHSQLNSAKAQGLKNSQAQRDVPEDGQAKRRVRVQSEPVGLGSVSNPNKSVNHKENHMLKRPIINYKLKDKKPVAKFNYLDESKVYPSLTYGDDRVDFVQKIPAQVSKVNHVIELCPLQKVSDPELDPVAGDIVILFSPLPPTTERETSLVYFHLGGFLPDPRKEGLNGEDSRALRLKFGEFDRYGNWESNLHVRLFCTTFDNTGMEVWKSVTKTFVTQLPFLHRSRRVPANIQLTDPHFKPRLGDLILRIRPKRIQPSSKYSTTCSEFDSLAQQPHGEEVSNLALLWWSNEGLPVCNDMIVRAYIGPAPQKNHRHSRIYIGRVELYSRTGTKWLFMGRDQHTFSPFDIEDQG